MVSALLEANVHYALFYIYTQLKSVSNAVVGQLPGLASPCFLWTVPCMVVIYQNDKRLLLQVMLDFVDSQKDSSSCSNEQPNSVLSKTSHWLFSGSHHVV